MENKTKEIIVIGSGIVGISCALKLQEEGFKITLVDKLGIGDGSSNRNACLLSASSVMPVSTPSLPKQIPGYLFASPSLLTIRSSYFPKVLPWLIRFLLAGRDQNVQKTSIALKSLQQDTLGEHKKLAGNSEAFQYIQESDLIYLYTNKQSYLNDSYSWKTRKINGVEFREMEADELREREPDLSSDYKFAVCAPKHGFILNTKKYLEALYQNFLLAGGKFKQVEVLNINSDQNRVELETDMGKLEAEKLVIAGGVWSANLAKKLGDRIPLESEGGYYIDISDPGIKVNHPLMNGKYKMAIMPISGKIRFAGLVEFGGIDCKSNFKLCKMLVDNAQQMFPSIQTEIISRGHGQRPSITDSLPVIGPSGKFQNIYYAFGHQHVGLSTGPVTGRLITELITTNNPTVDLSPFSAKRFS